MEVEGADEDVDIEGGEEPESASSLDTAGSGRPPSSSLALPRLPIRFQKSGIEVCGSRTPRN
jgi:hypothetical protein